MIVVQVSSMLIAMLNSTFILVAIFKFDCKKKRDRQRDFSFNDFWKKR